MCPGPQEKSAKVLGKAAKVIERIIEFSIRRRWVVILAAVALAVWGIRSAYRIPIDAIPDLSENQVIVFTEWPGQGPREIEDQVTYPLTLELQGLAGVRVVRSSSDVGYSMISVIFEDGTGWEASRRCVSEALGRGAAKLPPGVAPRLAPDADATGQIFWYTVEGPGYDPGRLRAVQDWWRKLWPKPTARQAATSFTRPTPSSSSARSAGSGRGRTPLTAIPSASCTTWKTSRS
jgi:Cu/Ag efflux pump CusA